MKRIVGLTLCLLAASMAHAEQKLRIIELGDDTPVSAEAAERGRQAIAAQEAAKKIKPEEALEFLQRLVTTVKHGHDLARSGTMNSKQSRDQAIALNKLQSESHRFTGVFAPFVDCYSAASDASNSWQGMIFGKTQEFIDYHKSYLANAAKCAKAAS